jgi:VanZ family protein
VLIPRSDSRFLLLVSLGICAGYFLVGLWPFNFLPRNRAVIPADGSGLSLDPLSIALSSRPLDLSGMGGITIELSLETEPAESLDSVLALYDGNLPENLLIAQWKSSLLIRTRVPTTASRRGYREAGIEAALRRGVRRQFAISSGPAGTDFYLDGILTDRNPRLVLRPETLRGRLVIGDSPAGRQGWKGKLSGLAIYGRFLSPAEVARNAEWWRRRSLGDLERGVGLAGLYFFDEAGAGAVADHSPARNALELPATFKVLHKTVLFPLREDTSPFSDITSNILGFIPFGFFFFLYRISVRPQSRIYNFLLTALAAACISTTIELVQVYLPPRSSQTSDVVCNTAGAILGMLITVLVPAGKPQRPLTGIIHEEIQELRKHPTEPRP